MKNCRSPFICNLGREVWKAKEASLPSDDLLGDQEQRGVLMEAITAYLYDAGRRRSSYHAPSTGYRLTKSLINGLMG